jgi:hypothetical protein
MFGMPGMVIEEFFGLTTYLQHLTLERCGYSVIEVLRLASQSSSQLRMIVLSGNRVTDESLDFAIPNRLKAVVIDHLCMKNPSLFFFLISGLPADSYLSMCKLDIGNSSWNQWMTQPVASLASFTGSQIANLCLDGSPIGPSAFRLLMEFGELRSVSLSYCGDRKNVTKTVIVDLREV